jgi:sphingolipid 4-desaturase/C4-monooxygenase
VNVLFQAGAMAALAAAGGWWPLVYLCSSTFFAIGLHPLGARNIQEHYVVADGQETYSYYGPLNKLAFNTGFHNEHHDLMSVPWSRLPRLRAMAPEFYDSLYAHRSWPALLWRFVMDGQIGPDRRIVRPDKAI